MTESLDEQKPGEGPTDWKAEARKWEDRSKANHAELLQLKQALQAQGDAKTDLEKALDRLNALEQSVAEKDIQLMKQAVASAKGVPVDLLVGSTEDELSAHADKILEFRGQAPAGPVIPKGGFHPAPPKPNDEQEFVKSLFRGSE